MLVGNGYNALAGFLAAELRFELLFEQAESDGGFGCGAGLGYYDDTEFFVLKQLLQFVEIVLADILSGK